MVNIFDNDLGKLVESSLEIGLPLREIRGFGSYGTDKWNEGSSDVDVMMLLYDESYSSKRGLVLLDGHICEGERRLSLRRDVLDGVSEEFSERLGLHIVTLGDVDRLIGNGGRDKGLARDMYNGKVLYSDFFCRGHLSGF